MRLINAASLEAAKALVVETVRQEDWREIQLWDGDRVIRVKRPATPAPVKKRDEVDDRSARIVAMRAEGKTQKQIATEFGIGIERVRQIIARVERIERTHRLEPNRAVLSVRAENVLRLLIDEPETDPSERDRLFPGRVAALTRSRVFNAPNAGARTVDEIEAWLWERGLCFSTEA
ncbi:sigma factor-like helix-turn-helix DNA-binding protein [Sphingobium sp. LB126]|uniref:sigma factor-like helix-turn-helix DNA-binding protein n=1 Tax=Sphingobium sp. LB126 TaxID=1983755 RepID=UPI0012FDB9A1|nr:sigma factor-like helix-turn-helix DNA-binding protein [Sphingobium sp. LB126]